MDESKSAESIVPNGTLRRRGRWRAATRVVVAVVAIATAGYVYDMAVGLPGVIRFYLSMPSMSRMEFLEIQRKAHGEDATSQLY